MRVIRTADPWRDTDVIDERAPRFVQATTGTVALLGVIFGWPLAWALMAAQLLIGLALGRRYCLPCAAYFVLVQPRLGEGRLEDARPPRLANIMGTVLLGSAAALWWLGAGTAATAIAAMVAALAAVGGDGLLRRVRALPSRRQAARNLARPPVPPRPGRPRGLRRPTADLRRVHPPAVRRVP
jgi:hypothetical protein